MGQIELFARRVRAQAHPGAMDELALIVEHLIERNYRDEIDAALPFERQVVELARLFRGRLTALVAHWMRVGTARATSTVTTAPLADTPWTTALRVLRTVRSAFPALDRRR